MTKQAKIISYKFSVFLKKQLSEKWNKLNLYNFMVQVWVNMVSLTSLLQWELHVHDTSLNIYGYTNIW